MGADHTGLAPAAADRAAGPGARGADGGGTGTLGPHPARPGIRPDVENWVVLAQDGHADQVLAETASPQLLSGLVPADRARVLYARSLAHVMLDAVEEATAAALQLAAFCRDHQLAAQGLLARALLVELYRRQGRLGEAVEELARAVAQEPGLGDARDARTQAAIGALAVALRTFGVPEEARRVEARLARVESELPRHQRVSRWSNLAIEHAIQAMSAGRVPPFEPDDSLLAGAVEEIARAVELAEDGSYAVVLDEASVLSALAEAVSGDPAVALALLERGRGVLARGREAVPARLLWGAARVRALVRLDRREEAIAQGRELLATVTGSGEAGDRMVLAYEVMRAETPGCEEIGSGAAEAVSLTHRRARDDAALIGALFRARVGLWKEVDERRALARRASLDSLTGLLNRRAAASTLEQACARPAGEPVALLLVDLDRFRTLNDVFGHLAGDVVLQNVARGLRSAVPEGSVLARWGGDEFVVVVACGAADAEQLAALLLARVREASETGAAEAVTASIGVSVREAPVVEADWVRRAELALYTAKRAGGDGAVLH